MEIVDPISHKCFHDIFRAAMLEVSAGISPSRTTAADSPWITWALLCQQVALNPLLCFYTERVPIIDKFAREYRIVDIAPNHKPIRYCTVDNSLRSTGQVLSEMGPPDPRIT